ncbi:DNA repair protein RadC [Pseudomonas sp. URIL14HWK12:I3]|uniref:JAB domain-containing protein n=1 Tax=unclassified Pseudomonas TaxID=196821 RepID=UPI000DADDCC3|nr:MULTISPECIES: JAB domain-containing protein [unclassified Pseudomonas]PZW50694.1 DNA repair protein RadC [Pseudomonas sp. URIL14HWK12:I2]PZW58466.1 DNA repair protein RadC [Pseudomonas sp. URIL14HWK12:I3]
MSQSYPSSECLVSALSVAEERLVRRAINVLEKRLFQRGPLMYTPVVTKSYLQLQLASHKNEVFAVIFLDSRHRVLAFEIMFEGTINSTAVPARRVLQRCLEVNSAAVILAHNHPSGDVLPSEADKGLTRTLKQLLSQVDVQVLDHFIVGSGDVYSFAERGIL